MKQIAAAAKQGTGGVGRERLKSLTAGSKAPQNVALGAGGEAPRSHLSLEHVHGYNGDVAAKSAARQTNCHWLRGGELVYPAAAAVVVLDPRSGKQRFFLGHSDYVRAAPPRASRPGRG